jgi:hypothetical protein
MVSLSGVQTRVRRAQTFIRRHTTRHLFGNTLPVSTNLAYARLARSARRDSPQSELATRGFEVVRALPVEKARQFSDRLSNADYYEHPTWQGAYRQFRRPIDAIGPEVFDVVSGELENRLHAFYGGHFRIQVVEAVRTFPYQPQGSYLWHCDNYPRCCVKILLYLTRTDEEGGGTAFYDLPTSRKISYDGANTKQRRETISAIAPFRAHLEPGQGVLFQPNILHKGIAPQRGYRDMLGFTFLPGLTPWRDALNAEQLQSNGDAPDRWRTWLSQIQS